MVMKHWIRIDDGQRTGSQAATSETGSPANSPADEDIALRKRIRELEEERDILRKAAKYFAGETRW